MNGSVMFVEICGPSITEGAAAVTVMLSLVPAGFSTASTRDVCESRSDECSRCVSIPPNVIEIAYSPGGSAEKLYAPPSPVMVDRVPCSAGEEIVTTTPGNALPSAVTMPVSEALVCPKSETAKNENEQTNAAMALFIVDPLPMN
jgi:hypothetical protein